MICDMCGVKVATKSIRSTRFGHIGLAKDLQHPFDTGTMLSCFPVVPADFMQSTGGERLQALYDELIGSNVNDDRDHLIATMTGIVEWLTPVVVMLHNWNVFPARNILARGIALEPLA
jgi:hypothetical protein